MKIAFFGTPSFTTLFLDTLSAHHMAPSLIVTNPDRPVGRGMTLTAPAPKEWAIAHDASYLQPEKITPEIINTLAEQEWDLFIVIAYGHIIPEALINIPKYGTINVHYSLLPKYRGASPVETALLNGDTSTGVAIQHMRYALDSGPIIISKEVPIEENDTTLSLRDKLNTTAAQLIPSVVQSFVDGTTTYSEQDHTLATMTKKISKTLGNLDVIETDIQKWNIFRAIGDRGWVTFTMDRSETPTRTKITKAHFDGTHFIIDEIIPENGKRQAYKK